MHLLGLLQVQCFPDQAVRSPKLTLAEFRSLSCEASDSIIEPLEKKVHKRMKDLELFKIFVVKPLGTAVDFGICATPTFIFFKEGKDIAQAIGTDPDAVISGIEKFK